MINKNTNRNLFTLRAHNAANENIPNARKISVVNGVFLV